MPDELDEILRSDEAIEPSPGFASAVMRAVYRESAEPPTAAFPVVPIRHRRSRVRVDDWVRRCSVVPC